MGNIQFAWDARKARSNLIKHGVSFEEAQSVFLDDNARLIDDPDHSQHGGPLPVARLQFPSFCLIVSHCYRESVSVIRLISARRATTQEQEMYWRFQ